MSETKVNFMWKHRVDDYNASGQTIAICCKENDVNRNKEMEKKIDIILNKLENKKDN